VVVLMHGQEGEAIRFHFWLLAADGRVLFAVQDYQARALVSLEATRGRASTVSPASLGR
jgi:hypothetical protein